MSDNLSTASYIFLQNSDFISIFHNHWRNNGRSNNVILDVVVQLHFISMNLKKLRKNFKMLHKFDFWIIQFGIQI